MYWSDPADPGQRWANLVGGAFAPLPNERPVPRFTLRMSRPGRFGARVVADAVSSYDPDGSIVRYRWTSDRRTLVGCRAARCVFRARHAGMQRIGLTVVDDRAELAASLRWLRVRAALRSRRGRHQRTAAAAGLRPRSAPEPVRAIH